MRELSTQDPILTGSLNRLVGQCCGMAFTLSTLQFSSSNTADK